MYIRIYTAVAVLLMFFPADLLRAQQPEGDSPGVVLVVSRQDETRALQIIESVKSQLIDAGASLQVLWMNQFIEDQMAMMQEVRRLAKNTRATAVFWYSLEPPGQVIFYLPHEADHRVLRRSLEGSDTGADEAIALIIRSVVSEAIESQPVVIKSPSDAPVAPATQPVREKAFERNHFVYGGYAPEFLSLDEAVLHGGTVGVLISTAPHFSFHLSGFFKAAATVDSELVEMEVREFPVHVGFAIPFPLKRTRLTPFLDARISFVNDDSSAVAVGGTPTPSGTQMFFAIAPGLRLDVLLYRRLWMYTAAQAVVYLSRTSYVIEINGEQEVLLNPPVVAVPVSVGLSLQIF